MKKKETIISIQTKESKKHVFQLTNKLFYICLYLFTTFGPLEVQPFQATVCSPLHLLHISVSRCCYKTVCSSVCVQVSSGKETIKLHLARLLQLQTVSVLFSKLFSAQSLLTNHSALFYQNTNVKTQNDRYTWEISDLRDQQAEHWFENTCWFLLEKQSGREHRKTKFPPNSMCIRQTSIFPRCSAFTQLHPQGKMRFKSMAISEQHMLTKLMLPVRQKSVVK